jgi:hypothetical protein
MQVTSHHMKKKTLIGFITVFTHVTNVHDILYIHKKKRDQPQIIFPTATRVLNSCRLLSDVCIDGSQQVWVDLFAVSNWIFSGPLLDFLVPFFARQVRQWSSGTPIIRVLAIATIDLSHGPVDLKHKPKRVKRSDGVFATIYSLS